MSYRSIRYILNFKLLISFLLLVSVNAFAQRKAEKSIPRDTSFNVRSTYLKEKKYRSYIEIVEPQLPANVKAREDMVYATLPDTPYGERDLHLDLYYPKKKSEGPFPGVILIHGGGWRSGDKSHLVPLAQRLAAQGYVTASVEYRLSMEAQFPAAILDVKTAIKWLKANAKKYNLDKERIAVLGTSAGAQMASLIGTTNGMERFESEFNFNETNSDVQAVVNIDGIVSFIHPEADAEGKAAGWWLGGGRENAPENWKAASAMEYVDEGTPPFIFINSSIPRFHAGRDDFMEILDGYGIYNEVYTLPDTPHPFWLFHPWFEETYQYTLGFLDKVFKEE